MARHDPRAIYATCLLRASKQRLGAVLQGSDFALQGPAELLGARCHLYLSPRLDALGYYHRGVSHSLTIALLAKALLAAD